MSNRKSDRPKETLDGRKAYLAEHVFYERQMLGHTFQRLHDTDEGLDWNAYYESFGIHARNLYQFLRNAEDKRSNFRADDYAPNWEPPNQFGDFNNDINYFIFHISTKRVDRQKMELQHIQALGEWLDKHWASWVGKITDEYKGILQPGPVCHPRQLKMGLTPHTACTVVTASTTTSSPASNMQLDTGSFTFTPKVE